MKKRLLAIILGLIMILQLPTTAFAASLPEADPADNTVVIDTGELPGSEINQVSVGQEAATQAEDVNMVNFELQLALDFPMSEAGMDSMMKCIMVSLYDAETGEHVHATPVGRKDNVITYQAEDVAPGEYILKMVAEYFFQDFEQNVTIRAGAKTTLVFSNSYKSYRGEGIVSPGVFAIGDLNDDGLINETDSNLLIEEMGQKSVVTEYEGDNEVEVPNVNFKTNYDLDQDGAIDIGDLGILVYNMNKKTYPATPIETVLKSAVTIEAAQQHAVPQGERTLDSIMDDAEENIVLAPENADEEISEENPVAIEMDFSSTVEVGGVVISAPAEKGPTGGTIEIEAVNSENPDGKGEKIIATIIDEGEETPAAPKAAPGLFLRANAAEFVSKVTAVRKADGSIVVDLGKQVAIKRVTIVVTATASTTSLTEIAKVEFLNDMEKRIPEPELNIPGNISVVGKGDSFTVTWDAENNVTAYQVAISAVDKTGKTYAERTYRAGVNQIKIETFAGGVKDKVTPLWTYYIRIKSVNGTWSSPYSAKVEHYQKPAGAPEPPDNVTINGRYRQLNVSWKDMPGTERYTLEYREKGTEEYTVVNDIPSNSYQITGLKDDTSYQVRICGWNTDDNNNPRRGGYSLPALGKTTVEIPKFSKYSMVSRDEIEAVSCFANKNPGGPGGFDNSKYPEGVTFNPEFIIDGDYTTYMHTNKGYPHGAVVQFKEEILLKEILMTNRLEDAYRDGTGYSQVIIEAWAADGTYVKVERPNVGVYALHPTTKNTMQFVLNTPIKAKKVKLSLSKYGAGELTISELNFFKYNSLETEVNALYADEMHVTLRDDVTEAMISDLEARLSVKDPVWDEDHPKKNLLLAELAYARELLVNKDVIGGTVRVKSDITKGDVNRIIFSGGLTGYQPLGYVAQSGSKINVYVGQKNRKVGDGTSVKLVFTQYHAESSAWQSGEIALYQGKNEITVPEVSSLDFEKGGSLYIVHTNPAGIAREPVEVRVSGATKIPTLDLHRTIGNSRFSIDEAAWKETVRAYVTDLKEYCINLSASHGEHQEAVGDYAFGNGSNCFLNATEISLDNVLLSVPASQILAGLGGAQTDIDTLTNRMYNSAVAMNQMVELFYKQRGFNPALANGYQGIPTARFNIRYHRMFAGAFMYAGGLHTGIEWGSVPALAAGSPLVATEEGKRTGGSIFGWGIAHELGHNADGGNLSFAEVTNNIWSQFSKTWDTVDTSRIPYAEVYKHVTSNSVGKASNVFAQLGMYWQLHLAYDKNYVLYNYYSDGFTTENWNNMIANEFFARFYAIARESSRAPQTAIRLSGGSTEQNIMRIACAAAQKDLTEFFTAWGFVVDSTTAAYAAQFPKEERKIQYLNDAAHEYTLANRDEEAGKMTSETVNASLVQGTGANARKVTLTISLPEEQNMNAVLGYEIIRNGKAVAFVEPAKDENGDFAAETVYVDTIATQNNRVMTYKVVAYDKYLNATSATELAPIKIRHEGVLPSDSWTYTTNTVSTAGVLTVYEGKDVARDKNVVEGNEYTDAITGEKVVYTPDMDVKYLSIETGETVRMQSAAARIADGDDTCGFEGTVSNGTAQITIALGGKEDIVGMSFVQGTTLAWKFVLESSTDGVNFSRITGFAAGTSVSGYPTLYFANGKNVRAVKATHIRITAPAGVKVLGIKEIQLHTPSGDNVDIGISTKDEATGIETWNTENAIGILGADLTLDAKKGAKIPAGSFIVTGKYTGNAAYNVVKLYNEKHVMHDDSLENKLNSIISGYQVFFADMPEEGDIVNVKDGFFVFWIEPLGNGQFGFAGANEDGSDLVVELPTKVYAELYRVDNAETLAGERLVSDSFTVDVPENLPTIYFENGAN